MFVLTLNRNTKRHAARIERQERGYLKALGVSLEDTKEEID